MSSHNDHADIDKNLKIGIILNTSFTIFEFTVGFFSGSLALMSDAGHNLTDALSLLISLFANKIAVRKADEEATYGYGRATIIAAFINSLILILLALYVFSEAYQRILYPRPVTGGAIVFVAIVGIIVNGIIALLFKKDKADLNVKSVFLNMALDVVALVGTLIAGILIILTKQPIIDPIISIFIGILLLYSAWEVVKDALHILLEGVPEGIDISHVKEVIKGVNSYIKDVDDLHIWGISSQYAAMSCHIIIKNCSLEKSMEIVKEIKAKLKVSCHITHATIETELLECPPDST